MAGNVIETHDLTMYYGKHRGIVDVSLEVQQGDVFGFLGSNGAGKTTTLRVLLDIIRPTKGKASIFGLDCQKDGVEIRKRISYLPGDLSLYRNMTGAGFLAFLASLHPRQVEPAYLKQLYERLELDPTRRIKEYSKGNRQKIGVVAAFMGKPDLIILDEPTSGLDPLMQQVVMELVLEAKDAGRTVFFSSHMLSEVQAVCDRVGIIREGQLIKTEQVSTLTKQAFKRLHLTLRNLPPADAFSWLPGVTETGRDDHTIKLEVQDGLDQVIVLAAPFGVTDIDTPPVTLEEIFLAFYGHQNEGNHHHA